MNTLRASAASAPVGSRPDGGGPGDAERRSGGAQPQPDGDGAVSDGDGAVPARRWKEWLRAAISPRMIGILLLLLLAAGVCIRLGAWQLDRAAIRGAAAAETEHAERLAAEPEPISTVLPAQTSFPADLVGRPVTAVGTFEPDQQLLVPDRAVDGEPATLVVTSFRIAEGPDAGAMLPVLRGWLDPEHVTVTDGRAEAADPQARAALEVPAGEREITGYLSGSEAAVHGEYPGGMVGAISSGQLANLWGGPSWAGYLVLSDGGAAAAGDDAADGDGAAAAGDGGLNPATPPEMPGEQGMNLQNLAYAAEWWIFGGFALLLWWRMLRDEVRHRREDAVLAAATPET